MTWLDLQTGIVEEFAGAQCRYVNATAIVAKVHAVRLARRSEALRDWKDRNQERAAEQNRRAVRAHYWRNRDAYKMKNRLAYLRRIGRVA